MARQQKRCAAFCAPSLLKPVVLGSGYEQSGSEAKALCDRDLTGTKRYQVLPPKIVLSSAVNRQVAGSNPARGANRRPPQTPRRLTSGLIPGPSGRAITWSERPPAKIAKPIVHAQSLRRIV